MRFKAKVLCTRSDSMDLYLPTEEIEAFYARRVFGEWEIVFVLRSGGCIIVFIGDYPTEVIKDGMFSLWEWLQEDTREDLAFVEDFFLEKMERGDSNEND